MKRVILLFVLGMSTFTFSQINKFVGNWKINSTISTDTSQVLIDGNLLYQKEHKSIATGNIYVLSKSGWAQLKYSTVGNWKLQKDTMIDIVDSFLISDGQFNMKAIPEDELKLIQDKFTSGFQKGSIHKYLILSSEKNVLKLKSLENGKTFISYRQ